MPYCYTTKVRFQNSIKIQNIYFFIYLCLCLPLLFSPRSWRFSLQLTCRTSGTQTVWRRRYRWRQRASSINDKKKILIRDWRGRKKRSDTDQWCFWCGINRFLWSLKGNDLPPTIDNLAAGCTAWLWKSIWDLEITALQNCTSTLDQKSNCVFIVFYMRDHFRVRGVMREVLLLKYIFTNGDLPPLCFRIKRWQGGFQRPKSEFTLRIGKIGVWIMNSRERS